MNVVELHYAACGTGKYLLIGRIQETPCGGCSFYTETKNSDTNNAGKPNNIPQRIYYNINTYLTSDTTKQFDDNLYNEPTLYIKDAPSGISQRNHPLLCLVKYKSNPTEEAYWYVAISTVGVIYSFDVCNPEYTTGSNFGLTYPFIEWFNKGILVDEQDLEDEENEQYSNITDNVDCKTIRHPYISSLSNIKISRLLSSQADFVNDFMMVQMPDSTEVKIGVLIHDKIYEQYNIYRLNGETTIIRNTVGNTPNTNTLSIKIREEGDSVFIKLFPQCSYSFDFNNANNRNVVRILSETQLVSFANNAAGSQKYNLSTIYPTSLDLSLSDNSLAKVSAIKYNRPILFKDWGTSSERNTLLTTLNQTTVNGLSTLVRGIRYYDTDLQKPLFLTSTVVRGAGGWYWVDANGNNPDIPIKGEQRPATTDITEGFEFYDSTLKKKILYNGTDWVNVDGTPLTNS